MILFLWDWQVDAIIDVKLGEADLDSYKYELMSDLLYWWETVKKDKHGNYYNYQQKHFSPFVLSVSVTLGMEDLVVLTQLSQTMTEKGTNPFHTYGGG